MNENDLTLEERIEELEHMVDFLGDLLFKSLEHLSPGFKDEVIKLIPKIKTDPQLSRWAQK